MMKAVKRSKKIKELTVLLLPLIFSQFCIGQDNYLEDTLYYDDGAIKSYIVGIDSTLFKKIEFYPNGSIFSYETYMNNQLHGGASFYYSNGVPCVFMSYKKNRLNGPFYYFDSNCVLLIEGTFLNNFKTGNWFYYNNSGLALRKCNYRMTNQDSSINSQTPTDTISLLVKSSEEFYNETKVENIFLELFISVPEDSLETKYLFK